TARHELAEADRLREVVVGAALEPESLVRLLPPRGQHQDGDVAVHRPPAHRSAHGQAVKPGQHEVEHDEVEPLLIEQLEGLGAASRRRAGQPLDAEMQTDQIADVRLVFDPEHGAARLCNPSHFDRPYPARLQFAEYPRREWGSPPPGTVFSQLRQGTAMPGLLNRSMTGMSGPGTRLAQR